MDFVVKALRFLIIQSESHEVRTLSFAANIILLGVGLLIFKQGLALGNSSFHQAFLGWMLCMLGVCFVCPFVVRLGKTLTNSIKG